MTPTKTTVKLVLWNGHFLRINFQTPHKSKNQPLCVVLTDMRHPSHALKLVGSITSTVSMSLAKRLTMRPIGVTSKKDIGLRNTFLSSILCRITEACTVAPAITMAPIMMNNAAAKWGNYRTLQLLRVNKLDSHYSCCFHLLYLIISHPPSSSFYISLIKTSV